jgi:hypothetical protein
MSAPHRLRQGVKALLAFRETPDLSLAASYLNMQQLALFRRMPHLEQVHAVEVLRSVLGYELPADADDRALDDLATAALLHDCGKSQHRVRVWQKTLPVLVKAASPDLFEKLSTGNPKNYLWRAFAVKAHHPAWGAQMAAHANSRPRVLWLIEHHQDDMQQFMDHPDYPLLLLLQMADDAN